MKLANYLFLYVAQAQSIQLTQRADREYPEKVTDMYFLCWRLGCRTVGDPIAMLHSVFLRTVLFHRST